MVGPAVVAMLLGKACLFPVPSSDAAEAGTAKSAARIRIDRGHAWRPPFGLDRIGQPLTAVVELDGDQRPPEVEVVGYLGGKEIARTTLTLSGRAPATGRARFDPWPTQLSLVAKPVQYGPELRMG
jgi:hypothetical protein